MINRLEGIVFGARLGDEAWRRWNGYLTEQWIAAPPGRPQRINLAAAGSLITRGRQRTYGIRVLLRSPLTGGSERTTLFSRRVSPSVPEVNKGRVPDIEAQPGLE